MIKGYEGIYLGIFIEIVLQDSTLGDRFRSLGMLWDWLRVGVQAFLALPSPPAIAP